MEGGREGGAGDLKVLLALGQPGLGFEGQGNNFLGEGSL